MLGLLAVVFMGWSLGSNAAANLFGVAVFSRMVRFWTSALLAACFVILGATFQGEPGIQTLSGLTALGPEKALLCTVAADLTVTVMTLVRLPICTAQAVVGALMGIALLQRHLDWGQLEKVVAAWLGTPTGAMVLAIVLYKLMARIYNRVSLNMFQKDALLRTGLILTGCYCSYALGANNVANVTGVFVGSGQLDLALATFLGGCSIAFGILTFSRGVMETVGRRLLILDPFSALVVMMAEALTVHFFALVGVPVSTAHAVIGAMLGIGLLKGVETVRLRTLSQVLAGWFLTPALGAGFFLLLYFLAHLRFVPDV